MTIDRIPMWLYIYLIRDFDFFEFCTFMGEVSFTVINSWEFESPLLWWNET